MTPIKIDTFLNATAPNHGPAKMDLVKMGLYHVAPYDNDRVVLAMRYDPNTGCFVPCK